MAATSALNPQTDFRRPNAVSYAFLNQPQQAAYFRAFAGDSLGRKEFVDIAEQHLCRAAENAGWLSESWHDAPVFIGSSSYSISECENHHFVGNRAVEEHNLLYLVEDLHRRSGNRQIFSLVTVCTSSIHVLIQADNCLRSGAECAFVLGIGNLNRLTLLHSHSLDLLTEQYRPSGGNGLILGEGVVAPILSSVTHESSSGRPKFTGHAANTGSDLIQSDGQAQEQVTRRALDVAGIAPGSIVAVKTHGIGMADSDVAELAALESIFGTLPLLMTFKPQIGHTLGATAALETALLLPTLKQGKSNDYQGQEIRFSECAASPKGGFSYLVNQSGFGGSNTSLVWQW